MAASSTFASRLKRELELLEKEPPPGISVWPKEERMDLLRACVRGAVGTPYQDGYFHLEVGVPPRYPFEPPRVKFITPIHHPNIDSSGRICLNILNMPPKGAWRPALNISTVLASIQLLLSEPNPDDGLMVEISEQFKQNREVFNKLARQQTLLHARKETIAESENALPSQSDNEDPAEPKPSHDNSDDDLDMKFSRKRARHR